MHTLGMEPPPRATWRSVCQAACLIESSRAASVRFCARVEGAQRRADADLRILLAPKQVWLKEADLCPPLSPFEKGSARWRRSINPRTCQGPRARCHPARASASGQVATNVLGGTSRLESIRVDPAGLRIKFA